MDKNDARQVLNLLDIIRCPSSELVMSTVILDEPKIIHSKKYWFESYLIETQGERTLSAKLVGQYSNCLDAVQQHKLIFAALNEVAIKFEDKLLKVNQELTEAYAKLESKSEVTVKLPKKQSPKNKEKN